MTVNGTYVVKANDTLGVIAKRNNVSVAELAKLNGITDPNKIAVGQEIKLNGAGNSVDKKEISDTEFQEKFNATQKELDKLKGRTLSQQAKQEIAEFVKAKKEMVKALGKEVATAANETIDECEAELVEAYQKGTEAVNVAKAKANKAIMTAINTAKSVGNAVTATAQQAQKEVAEFIKEKKEMAKTLSKEAAASVNATIDECEAELIAAYQNGTAAYNKAKAKANKAINTTISTAKSLHNNVVNTAETGVGVAARYVKNKVAGGIKDMKADIPQKKTPAKPDFSKMTKEQLLAYQQSELQKLQSETLTDRASREIKAEIEEVETYIKTKYNSAVDATYDTGKAIYNGVADAAKKVFGWFKFD